LRGRILASGVDVQVGLTQSVSTVRTQRPCMLHVGVPAANMLSCLWCWHRRKSKPSHRQHS